VAEERARLRPVREGDEAFLERVYASTREEELALTGWSAAQKQAFLTGQFRAQHDHYRRHYPRARFDIIEIDDEAAGRLYVDRGANEVRIVDIALLPAFRGQGIGGVLLRALLDESAVAGRTVSIHVERMNPALRLYRRLGFQVAQDDGGIYLLMRWSPPANAS
jgi:ribosomal protein S18 acetylase RimI-like enzyme